MAQRGAAGGRGRVINQQDAGENARIFYLGISTAEGRITDLRGHGPAEAGKRAGSEPVCFGSDKRGGRRDEAVPMEQAAGKGCCCGLRKKTGSACRVMRHQAVKKEGTRAESPGQGAGVKPLPGIGVEPQRLALQQRGKRANSAQGAMMRAAITTRRGSLTG